MDQWLALDVPVASVRACARVLNTPCLHVSVCVSCASQVGESTEALRKIFDQIDVDGNGELDKQEVQQAFAQFGMHRSDADIAAMMRVADDDTDGGIDFDEFVKIVREARAASSRSPRRFPW